MLIFNITFCEDYVIWYHFLDKSKNEFISIQHIQMTGKVVETNKSQLRKDFYAQISHLQAYTLPQTKPTLSLLTEEELQELEAMWVEHSVWKIKQNH